MDIEGLIEHDGQYELVRALDCIWADTIRRLLRGQSNKELEAFETDLAQLVAAGHELTGLIAHLRCPSQEGVVKTWTCELRPKDQLGEKS